MATPPSPAYVIEGRELIAESAGLRVQVLTIGAGQCVPWHRHSEITDTFFCLQGPMLIETREPDASHHLTAGDRCSVPPGRAHFVSGEAGGRCRFVIVQGVGVYDYVPVDDVDRVAWRIDPRR
jgi:quercetin dioxygenase-like cupin family protein